jgi:hypothetical protein
VIFFAKNSDATDAVVCDDSNDSWEKVASFVQRYSYPSFFKKHLSSGQRGAFSIALSFLCIQNYTVINGM